MNLNSTSKQEINLESMMQLKQNSNLCSIRERMDYLIKISKDTIYANHLAESYLRKSLKTSN